MSSKADPNTVGYSIMSERVSLALQGMELLRPVSSYLSKPHLSTWGCQAMRRYLPCILQIREGGTPRRQATFTGQVVQAQRGLGTSTRNALADLCHCRYNRWGRDVVWTQNVLYLNEVERHLNLWRKDAASSSDYWLVKKRVFSVITMMWWWFWFWTSQRSCRKQKKKKKKSSENIRLRFRLLLFQLS